MNPRHFVSELRRRNVYKVAVAYAVVGWLVMQVAAHGRAGASSCRFIVSAVVVLTLLGFPIALGYLVGLRDDAGRNETNREC